MPKALLIICAGHPESASLLMPDNVHNVKPLDSATTETHNSLVLAPVSDFPSL